MNYIILPLDKGTGSSRWIEIATNVDESQGWTTAADLLVVEAMQAWCQKHQCGTRMSYDQFAFKNEQQLGMFMLRWS